MDCCSMQYALLSLRESDLQDVRLGQSLTLLIVSAAVLLGWLLYFMLS
jgi:hypothetical protein